jgi:lysophospholipase L1-like esterase
MSAGHLLLLGDSHLAGVGDPTRLGWIGRVLATCRRRGRGFSTRSLVAADATSLELVSRWTYAPRPLKAETDARAVISYGVADAAAGGLPSREPDRRSIKHLGVLLDEMTAAGLGVYVVGPAPVSETEHRRRIGDLSAAFGPVCEERQVPYASVFEPLLDSLDWIGGLERGDGAHPGAAGYEALAELLVEVGLVDWLCGPVAPQGLPHRRGSDPRAEAPGRRSGPGRSEP